MGLIFCRPEAKETYLHKCYERHLSCGFHGDFKLQRSIYKIFRLQVPIRRHSENAQRKHGRQSHLRLVGESVFAVRHADHRERAGPHVRDPSSSSSSLAPEVEHGDDEDSGQEHAEDDDEFNGYFTRLRGIQLLGNEDACRCVIGH